MSNFKKRIDLSGSPKSILERLSNVSPESKANSLGIGGDPIYEPIPKRINLKTEKIIENGSGAIIVLGRDRPASRFSGYGGKGHTQAASIDVVVGPFSAKLPGSQAVNGQRVWVNPSFELDAARIYLSQKTDIDKNFGISPGKVGNSIAKSGLALKADAVRLIGREGIKLVTKIDKINSQGGSIVSIPGIDLIAGNLGDDLQPIPKGENVSEALKRLAHHVDKLNGIVDSLLMAQMMFNQALTHHFHFSPFFGLPTTPSPVVVAAGMKTMLDHLVQTKRSLVSHKANVAMFKMKYLEPIGSKYINSRFNNVN